MNEIVIEFLKVEYPECTYRQVGRLVYIEKNKEQIDIKDISHLEYLTQTLKEKQ